MSHKIDDVLEAVLASYAEYPAIGKIGETHFPKRHLILSALKKLQCVIFPGFFDEKELRNDNIRFYAGQLLEEIRELLTEQIAKTLRLFTEEFCDASDEVVEKRSEEIVGTFLSAIPKIREYLATDIEAAFEGDPAAFSRDEVISSYPGIYATMVNQVAHEVKILTRFADPNVVGLAETRQPGRRDDRDPTVGQSADQHGLRVRLVEGFHYHIAVGEKVLRILLSQPKVAEIQFQLGIDPAQIFRQRHGFLLADLIRKEELTVQIARRDHVEIGRDEPTDPGTNQMREHIRPEAAKPGDADFRPFEDRPLGVVHRARNKWDGRLVLTCLGRASSADREKVGSLSLMIQFLYPKIRF